MPVVSHSVTPRAPISSTKRAHQSSTVAWRHVALHRAAERARQRHVDGRPSPAAPARSPPTARRTTASRVMRRLARLWLSLADITRLNSSVRASIARSAPRTLGTSAL